MSETEGTPNAAADYSDPSAGEQADDGPRLSPDELPRSQADIERAMRLRPAPPRVMRLSRKMLAASGGVGAAALAAALVYALQTNDDAPPTELVNTETRQSGEALSGLPRDYSEVPRLGPPLPGDLGRPMLAAGVAPDAPIPSGASEPPSSIEADPQRQAIAHRRQQLAQERDAARASALFAAAARGQDATNARASTTEGPGVEARAGSAPVGAPATQPDARLERKLAGAGPTTPQGGYSLQAGAVIPAALLTGIRSDLPGQVTAQVTENVYDGPTGRVLLIPQGARLVGRYGAETGFGQRRVFLTWSMLILPDGRSVALGELPGADPQGFAGVEDRVDNHWGQVLRAALISTLLSIGAEAGSDSDEDALVRALRRGSSDAISQAGRQIVGRSLDIEPTLTVRPGYPVRAIVTRELVLQPWLG